MLFMTPYFIVVRMPEWFANSISTALIVCAAVLFIRVIVLAYQIWYDARILRRRRGER